MFNLAQEQHLQTENQFFTGKKKPWSPLGRNVTRARLRFFGGNPPKFVIKTTPIKTTPIKTKTYF
jgi:hypothetical protein